MLNLLQHGLELYSKALINTDWCFDNTAVHILLISFIIEKVNIGYSIALEITCIMNNVNKG